MTELFIATLGPVQPFIASARVTRDLFVGSTLLSELSRAAALAVAQRETWERLIFPAPDGMKDLEELDLSEQRPTEDTSGLEGKAFEKQALNVANKLVALIEGSAQELGDIVYRAVQKQLLDVAETAFTRVKGEFDRVTALQQIEDLVEVAWVAVPYTDGDYKKAREAAEDVLGARKYTHAFQAVPWSQQDVKSSIDGKLECVIPDKNYPRRSGDERIAREKAFHLFRRYGAGPDERLSGVDLMKRNASELGPPPIPSTSHLAALPYLQAIGVGLSEDQVTGAQRRWEAYIEAVKTLVTPDRRDNPDGQGRGASSILEYVPKAYQTRILGPYDGGLLFEERLREDTVYKQKFSAVQLALKHFFDYINSCLGAMHPDPYYAILVADGDSMGKTIDALAEHGPKQHRAFSQSLATFARKARRIIERHSGVAVYTGGDDVMALLPLHKALACARELATAFEEGMKKALEDIDGKQIRRPTLSAGLAVIHHLSLLQDALAVARSAEGRAKQRKEKNALAIIIKKRGGEDYTIVLPWQEVDERLQRLVDLYRDDLLPTGTAYELRDMQQRFKPIGHATKADEEGAYDSLKVGQAMQVDAARILRRKLLLPQSRLQKSMEAPRQEVVELLLGYAGVRMGADKTLEVIDNTTTLDIAPLINQLIVAQVFAEAQRPFARLNADRQAKGEIA